MPGLAVTVGEQIAALKKVAGDKVVARIRREPDPFIETIVAGWPRNFAAQARAGAGLQGRRQLRGDHPHPHRGRARRQDRVTDARRSPSCDASATGSTFRREGRRGHNCARACCSWRARRGAERPAIRSRRRLACANRCSRSTGPLRSPSLAVPPAARRPSAPRRRRGAAGRLCLRHGRKPLRRPQHHRAGAPGPARSARGAPARRHLARVRPQLLRHPAARDRRLLGRPRQAARRRRWARLLQLPLLRPSDISGIIFARLSGSTMLVRPRVAPMGDPTCNTPSSATTAKTSSAPGRKEEDDAVMAKLAVVQDSARQGRQARARRPADADDGRDDAAQGPRAAAGDRRPVRRDQGAAARLLHCRLRSRSRRRSRSPASSARPIRAAPTRSAR